MSSIDKYNKMLSNLGVNIASTNYILDKYKNEGSKLKLVQTYFFHLLRISSSMFTYENLPDEIPEDILEYRTQMAPTIFARANDGKVYNMMGGMKELNANYRPKKFIVANPYLDTKNEYTIDEDCVLYYNDYLLEGMYDLIMKYATMLAENDISLYVNGLNTRAVTIFSASTDNVKQSIEQLQHNLVNGYSSVVRDSTMITNENFKVQNAVSPSSGTITNLIELQQYLKASFLNEIGLNANYNMKREAINSNESQLNTDMLRPLCDQMLDVRKRQIEKVNEMFGLNIIVDFNDVWKTRQVEDVTTDDVEETNEVEEITDDEVH